jgi:hypothetical protein
MHTISTRMSLDLTTPTTVRRALLEDLWVEFDPAVQAIARAKEAAAAAAAAAASSSSSIAKQATL